MCPIYFVARLVEREQIQNRLAQVRSGSEQVAMILKENVAIQDEAILALQKSQRVE